MDVAFISACTLLPSAAESARPGSDVLVLIKPQFEAPHRAVDVHGVVTNVYERASAVASVIDWGLSRHWRFGGMIRSPLKGPAGNLEYLAWFRTPAQSFGEFREVNGT